MPTTLENVLHDYLDQLEDIQLDSAARLVELLGGLNGRVWFGLSRAETMRALTRRLGFELARYIIPRTEQVALNAAARLGRSPRGALHRLQVEFERKGNDRASREVSVLLTPRQEAAAVSTVTSAISQPLQDVQARVERLITSVQPRNAEDAEVLLRRVEAEIIEPLRGSSGLATLRESTNVGVHDIGTDLMSMADVKLRALDASPDDLERLQRDAEHTWICALVRTCHDCLPRHGQSDTMGNWRRRGKPRSGWSVCRGHCKCLLLPRFGGGADHAGTVKPLRREAMQMVEEGTPRGLTVRLPSDALEQESHTLKGKQARQERLKAAHADDIRVRRAMRILGSLNASGGDTEAPAAS